MANADKPTWSHKELKTRIDRLKRAEEALAELNPPRDVFGSEIESIKAKLRSVPRVEEVEAELAVLTDKVDKYRASLREAATAEQKATQALNEASTQIEKAKSAGCAIPDAEGILAQAHAVFDRKDYQLAAEYAGRAAESAAQVRRTAKPQVIVRLGVENYTPGEWKAVDLSVVNQGKAPAQEIELQFSPEVEVKWVTGIARVEAGAMEVLKIGLKPRDSGDIPLDVELSYKDAQGKAYSGVQRFWLQVGKGLEAQKTVAEAAVEIGPLPQLETYTLERKIGSGGFADVYLGRDAKGTVAALKIPRLSQYETIEAREFVNEAELWSKLSKLKLTYIVQLYEYATAPYPWIAMEYMEGGTLRDRMSSLECKDCLEIAMKLMQSLLSAHFHGVIHRDIKPENVLFDSRNTPKLTDWGLGKVLLDASRSSVGFRGTLAYSAPEQLAGSRFGTIDWRTDIYQSGMLVYELIAKRLPFAGYEAGSTITSILNDPPQAPSQLNSQIPPGLDNAVLRAIAKRKEDRYQSMDAFRDQLQKIARNM